MPTPWLREAFGRPPGLRTRRRGAGGWLRVEELEDRIVPALTWASLGEGSVAGNVVTMGVAGRAESAQQPIDFHGAYAQLPASKHYEIAFKYDLSSWDSYNADTGGGKGYWDSFSVSITASPYPQLNVLTDPLQLPFVWGGTSWTDGTLETTSGYKVITADFNVATPRYLNVVLDTRTIPTADNNYPSWGTITIITGDLGMVKNDGSEVPDNQQTTAGGYVALNNIDANYNGKADKDDAGPIAGETTLVPLKIHPVDPAAEGGTYSLANISPNLKVWQNKDKTGAVDATTKFDATKETTLYVEGVGPGAGKAKDGIDLKWTNGKITATVDQVKYTVYTVTGAKNVADYSIMTYTGTIPGGATGSWTAANGTIKSGQNTNSAKILWGGGPAIGKATFSPAAGWSVDYEVNIVQVLIEAPTAGNAFTAGTPSYSGNVNFGVLGPVVSSGAPGVGMSWRAKVTLNGPSAYGVDQRGVTHIEVGFVQNLTFTAANGVYSVGGVNQTRTANIQGKAYHDSINPADVYYTTGGDAVFKPSGTAAADRTKDALTSSDTPTAGVPLYYKMGNALAPPGDAVLATMHFTDTFKLWITARTDDTDNGASDVYTARALANWSFAVNENYPMANPLANSTVTVPANWSEVKDGSEPTLKGGTSANQALAGITFT